MRTKLLFTFLLVLSFSLGFSQHTYRSHWKYLKDIYTKESHAFTTKSLEKDLKIKRYPVPLECYYTQFIDSTGRGKTLNEGIKNLLDKAAQDGPIYQAALGKLKVAWPWFITKLLSDYHTWTQPDVDYTDAELQEIKVHPVSMVNGNLFVDVRYEFVIRIGRSDEELAFSIPYWISPKKRHFEPWITKLNTAQQAAVQKEVLAFLEPKIEHEKGVRHTKKKPRVDEVYDPYYDRNLTPTQHFFLQDEPDLEKWIDWNQIELIPFAWGMLFRFPAYSPSSYSLNEDFLGGFVSFEPFQTSLFKGTGLAPFSPLRLKGSNKNFKEFNHKVHRTKPYTEEIDYLDLAKKNALRTLTIHHENKDNVQGNYYRSYREILHFDHQGHLIEVNRINSKGKNTFMNKWFYTPDGDLEKFLINEVERKKLHFTHFKYDNNHNRTLLTSANNWEFTHYDENMGYRFRLDGKFQVPDIEQIRFEKNTTVYEHYTEFLDNNHKLIAIGGNGGAYRTVQMNRNENGQILEYYSNGDRERKFWEYDDLDRPIKYTFHYDRTTKWIEWEYHESNSSSIPNRALLHKGNDKRLEYRWEKFNP